MRMKSWLHLGLFFAVILITPQLSGQETRREEQLRQLLLRFPKADTDQDGVLTEEEARAYRNQNRQQQTERIPQDERPKPTLPNVSYGPHRRNVLDVYLASSDSPTPLIIYIHGGGFVGGDKNSVSPRLISAAHDAGISVAAIHYRFVSEVPFPAPQEDAARAVQFLRSNAKKWNFDPARFAAYGGSAGAGLSLWLGFHEDLADPKNEDPIKRESTRLVAIGSRGGQTTYDPQLIRDWVGGRAFEHPSIFKCFGITSIEQISEPRLQPLYDEVSAIKHLTADDPPVHMIYNEPDGPLPPNARPGQGIHHPVFARKLIAEMDKLKIEHVYRHTNSFQENGELDMLKHFKKWFGIE